MKRGIFISIEGTDGSGKTTQIELIKQYFTEKGFDVVLTREPGGTRIGEQIREILLNPENTEMGIKTEMLLYAAARAQLMEQVIKPSIEQGKIVICDRFVDSSYVYQGIGRGIGFDEVISVNKPATEGLLPDITLFLDLDPEKALQRRKTATGADRMESESSAFHKKVYNGYKKLAAMYPDRIKTINCDKSIAEIAAEIRMLLDKLA